MGRKGLKLDFVSVLFSSFFTLVRLLFSSFSKDDILKQNKMPPILSQSKTSSSLQYWTIFFLFVLHSYGHPWLLRLLSFNPTSLKFLPSPLPKTFPQGEKLPNCFHQSGVKHSRPLRKFISFLPFPLYNTVGYFFWQTTIFWLSYLVYLSHYFHNYLFCLYVLLNSHSSEV